MAQHTRLGSEAAVETEAARPPLSAVSQPSRPAFAALSGACLPAVAERAEAEWPALDGASEQEWSPAPLRLPRADADAPLMRLFHHHVYEYGRGVRSLFLMTLSTRELPPLLARLERHGIDHFVQQVSGTKVNLFFGRDAFVAVARAVVTRPLNLLTAEEDFMLGTMLGYDREQQCRRYLSRSGRGMPQAAALAAE